MEKRNMMMKEYDNKIKRLRAERQDRIERQAAAMKKQKEDQKKEATAREVLRYQTSIRKKKEVEERFETQERNIMARAAEMEAKAQANLNAVHERQAHEAKLRAEQYENDIGEQYSNNKKKKKDGKKVHANRHQKKKDRARKKESHGQEALALS